MVHPHTAVKGLASYTTESGCLPLSFIRCHVVTAFFHHLCRSSDVIQSSPLSFIRCHVVTAFFHHLCRSPDVIQSSPLSFIRCHVVTTLIRCHVLTHSFIISIVHQMPCCDCIQSSPLSSSHRRNLIQQIIIITRHSCQFSTPLFTDAVSPPGDASTQS